MKQIEIKINLYEYEELKEEAKELAFNEHKDFMDNLEEEYENEKGEMIKEYFDHDKESVEDSLKVNEYLFFENGEMADVTHYCGKHQKAGTSEVKFMNVIYKL